MKLTNETSGWYLIYTKPNHEKKVQNRLSQINITSYLPVRKTLKIRSDRKKIIDEPLFPSYLFIYLNDMNNYFQGLDIEGCLYYVRTGKKVSKIDDSIINNIKIATHQENECFIANGFFAPGKKLLIKEGILTGLTCEVVDYNNKERLLVRIDLLQRNLLITLQEKHLITA